MFITFFSIVLISCLHFINTTNNFLQTKRELQSCPHFLGTQTALQIIHYTDNNVVRIYFDSSIRYGSTPLTITFIDTNSATNTYGISTCSILQDELITCTINSISDIPPGVYKVAYTHNATCATITSSFLVYIEQTEVIPEQMIVNSFIFKHTSCTSEKEFTINIANGNPTSEITGYFLSELSFSLEFSCDNINSTSRELNLTCRISNSEQLDKTGYFSLKSLKYTLINQTPTIAYINTKDTITFNKDYNPLDVTLTKTTQNLNSAEQSQVKLYFEKNFDSTTQNIIFLNRGTNTNKTITDCIVIDNEITCNIASESIDKKVLYDIYITNACGIEENIGVTVNYDVFLAVEYPDFSNQITNSTCRRNMDSFSILVRNIETATSSIKGNMISPNSDKIYFTCGNVVDSPENQTVLCTIDSVSANPVTGVYHIDTINYTIGSTTIDAYLTAVTSTVNINSNYAPLIDQALTFSINYVSSNSFDIPYEYNLSTTYVPTITLINDGISYSPECISVNSLVRCTIDDPTLIPAGKEYSVTETNACGNITNTQYKIKTEVLELGEASFVQSETSCTDNISNFTIEILANSINASLITGNLINSNSSPSLIQFKCNDTTISANALSCYIDTYSSNGVYSLHNLDYVPTGSNQDYSEKISSKVKAQTSTIYYHSSYNKFVVPSNNTITINNNNTILSLTFQNVFTSSQVTFLFITSSGWNNTVTCTTNNYVVQCVIGKTIPQGTYSLQYTNACEQPEILDIAVNVEDPDESSNDFILGDPSFNNDQVCVSYKSLSQVPTFTIEIKTNSLTRTGINGIVESKESKSISFICNNITRASTSLSCTFTVNTSIPSGRYTLASVSSYIGNDTTTEIPAYLKNQISFLDYNPDHVDYNSSHNNPSQLIDDDAKKVELIFEDELTDIPTMSFVDSNNKKFPISCTRKVNNTSFAECDVSSLSNEIYSISFTNKCGATIQTGITVYKTSAMIFSTPVFSSSECTNSIDTFTMNYIGTYISNNNLSVTLTNNNALDNTISYSCYYSSSLFSCSLDSSSTPKNGTFSTTSITYFNTITSKQEEGVFNNKSAVVNYNSLYNALSDSQNSRQTIDFLTNSNLTINFKTEISSLMNVIVNDGTTDQQLNNCSIISSNIVSCLIDSDTFSTNGNYTVKVNNACGKEEDTSISMIVQHLTSNSTYDPGLDNLSSLQGNFYDPDIDNNSYLRFSYIVGIVIFLI